MKFKSMYIKEGMFEKKVNFSDGVNLIHSVKNSRGKTTLLRFMLYALGYSIPNTRGIKFNRCEVEMIIENDRNDKIVLRRAELSSIQIEVAGKNRTFVLPDQQDKLQSEFFGTNDSDLLSNLLGAYYLDQEKGWTLLNRGVVIGSIHFNIEELIRSLAGIDCSELIKKEAQLNREISKYRQMFSVAQYQQSIQISKGQLVFDNYEEDVNIELDGLFIQQRELKYELKRIDSILQDNNRFKKFVSDMKLLIRTPEGEVIRVTEDSIVGLNDSINLLVLKRKNVLNKLNDVINHINILNNEINKENEQIEFFKTASQLEIFDKRITRMPLNSVAISKEVKKLEKEIRNIREDINKKTKKNNSIISDIAKTFIKYALELELDVNDLMAESYIFTSNLKELSGALLHKTAFAFRLAYIVAIEKKLNIILPIILDSPSGKEVDKENVALMMRILRRDFKENQIIIASIFKYDFDEFNEVEIKDRLIETPI